MASNDIPEGKPLWQVFEEDEVMTPKCPHCGSTGTPTNKYLLRCDNVSECGRYFA